MLNSAMFAANPEDRSDPKEKMHSPEDWEKLIHKQRGNIHWPEYSKALAGIPVKAFDKPDESYIPSVEDAK